MLESISELRKHAAVFVVISVSQLFAACSDPSNRPRALPPDGPGTTHEDSKGHITGTGWMVYFYEDGKTIEAKDAYVDGEPVYSAWFKPDRTLVAEQYWVKGTGTQYYLWEDGSIKSTVPMVGGIASGTATYYRRDRTVEKTVQYKNGKPVNN